jgi:hypothetical protein
VGLYSLISHLSKPYTFPSGANLRLLERPGEVEVHGLPFGEDVEGGLAGFAVAIAGGRR